VRNEVFRQAKGRAAAVLVGVLLAPALGAASAADAPLQTIRVATNPIDAGSEVYYAQKMGFFAKHGINVEITGLTSGAAITAAVIGGSADVGQSNAVSVAQAHERGIPVQIIAGANRYLVQADESALIVSADSPIHTARDLNGKTIAINGVRGIAEIVTRNWVDKNGGDAKTLKFLDLPFTAMAEALDEHRVDAALPSQPQLQAALDSKKVRLVADAYAAIASDFLIGGWIATTPWVQAHRALAASFAQAMYETAKWANTHHAESAAILEEVTNIHMARSDHRVPFAEKLTASDLQPLIDACAKYGILKTAFPAGQIVLQ
jgi:NitT/TauT family transport system substrate-binding protein